MAGHFLIFNYDGNHQIMVTIFDEDMCHRHYVTPACGKAVVSSSSSSDEDQ
jgi:hypothetical protein